MGNARALRQRERASGSGLALFFIDNRHKEAYASKSHYLAMKKSKRILAYAASFVVWILCAVTVSSCSVGEGGLNRELLPVKVGAKWGYINLEGNFVINPQFDVASLFVDGRAMVWKDDKIGVIDTEGNYVVSPKYLHSTTIYSEGLAWVVEEGHAPMLIDRDGDVLLEMKKIESAWPFREGLAKVSVVQDDNTLRYGFINKKGEFVIEPKYTDAKNFSDGLAAVEMDGETVYIDTEGNVIINNQAWSTQESFRSGYAVVTLKDADSDAQSGIIDTKGNYVVNPQFMEMANDTDCFMFVNSERKIGWCDRTGKIDINPQFDFSFPFVDNDFAAVRIGDVWGFIDRKGKIVINPQYDVALPFINNKVAPVQSGGKWGLIDKDGKYVVNPQFSDFALIYAYIYCGEIDAIGLVDTDYFDAEQAADLVLGVVTEKGIDGMAPGIAIEKVLKKYNKDEASLYHYADMPDMYSSKPLGSMMNTSFSVGGDFFKTVSDGWWGTTRTLVKNAEVKYMHYIITMKGRGTGKQTELIAELAKRFGLKDNKAGKLGKFGIDIIEMIDGCDIVLALSGAFVGTAASADDSNSAETADNSDADNNRHQYVYAGKIDGKHAIEIKLDFNGSDVTGDCRYTKSNTIVELSGFLGDDGIIHLDEKVGGAVTGQFVGDWSGQEISGTWVSDDGKRELPFLVSAK